MLEKVCYEIPKIRTNLAVKSLEVKISLLHQHKTSFAKTFASSTLFKKPLLNLLAKTILRSLRNESENILYLASNTSQTIDKVLKVDIFGQYPKFYNKFIVNANTEKKLKPSRREAPFARQSLIQGLGRRT